MGRFIFFAVALFFLSVYSLEVFAQSPAIGCLLPNNRVYTDDWTSSSSTYYHDSPYNSLPANRCSWNLTSGVSVCYVSSGRTFVCVGFLCLGGSYYNYDNPISQGVKGTFTASAVGCPLDESIFYLILPISILGFYCSRNYHKVIEHL